MPPEMDVWVMGGEVAGFWEGFPIWVDIDDRVRAESRLPRTPRAMFLQPAYDEDTEWATVRHAASKSDRPMINLSTQGPVCRLRPPRAEAKHVIYYATILRP